MNCIEARRMVTPFVNKELSDRKTEQFLHHIEHCSDCMDEFNMYFTVYKALDTLESAGHQDYNFEKLMQEELRATKRHLKVKKTCRAIRCVVLALCELMIVASIYMGIRLKNGTSGQSVLGWTVQNARLQEETTTGEETLP